MKKWKLYIGGQWREGKKYEQVIFPYDGKPFALVARGDEKALEDAVSAATTAFRETSKLPSHKLSNALSAVSEEIKARREEIARIIAMEAGKPITQARVEAQRATMTFKLASEEATRLKGEVLPVDISPASENFLCITGRFPLGVIAGISPFNFPLNLVAHKVAPALAAGNAVVLKPASKTPLSSLLLAEIIHSSGFPRGAFNVVNIPSVVAEKMTTHERIKMLTFTGSSDVGWNLAKKAWKKKIALELGGNAAAIVHSDADIEWAARRCALGAMMYAGQICISLQRIYIHHKVYEKFKTLLLENVLSLKTGNPLDEDTVVGPLIDSQAAQRITQWLKEACNEGAKLLCGGKLNGNAMEPAVLENAPSHSKVKSEEIFGPVVTIDEYDNFELALNEANSSRFGLQGAVFTKDMDLIEKAYREFEVGGVVINDMPTIRVDNYPYGGVKDSGRGREGVGYAMQEMTELKTLVIKKVKG